ncbi:hypothetical protein PCANC_01121, partial [Puccinia coronata f. sp. avenae]
KQQLCQFFYPQRLKTGSPWHSISIALEYLDHIITSRYRSRIIPFQHTLVHFPPVPNQAVDLLQSNTPPFSSIGTSPCLPVG